jgi:hypothetical protein
VRKLVLSPTLACAVSNAADKAKARNRHGEEVLYNHPVMQAAGMFIGMSFAYFPLLWENRQLRGGWFVAEVSWTQFRRHAH